MDNFGVSAATNKICAEERKCKLDFGPAQVCENP